MRVSIHSPVMTTPSTHEVSQLLAAWCDVLQGRPCPTPESFYRLRSACLAVGESTREVRPRCQLYATYLEKHLL